MQKMRQCKDALVKVLLILPLFLIGCRTSEPYDTGIDIDSIELSFTKPVVSRAIIGEDGSGSFEEGDRVGVYVGTDQPRYYILTLEGGVWQPRLSRAELGSGVVTINACYPAIDASGSGSYIHHIDQDQRADGFSAADILWSHLSVDVDALSGNRIELPFYHGLHRVEISLKSESGELPSDLEIAVRSAADVEFEYASGQAGVSDGSAMAWITPYSDTKGVFHAIVAPQSLSELKSEEGWIRITANGKTSMYVAPDEVGGSTMLEMGKESRITLNLKTGVEEDIDWANRKVWVYGVKSPVFDESKAPVLSPGSDNYIPGEWYINRVDWGDDTYSDYYYLPWVEGCGWYDCNKTYPWDNASDNNLCWAAASSNLIHWWLEHNAPYVEAYDKAYSNTSYYQRYPRPDAAFSPYPVKSRIFQLFINTFKNKSAAEGIHWFVNGSSGYGTSIMTDPSMAEFDGYFKEVFDISDKIYIDYRAMSKARFNEVLKDALANRKAINFVWTGNHSLTIWGAEFDDQGYASYLYYVDNNPMGSVDPAGAVCVRLAVSYREDPVMNLKDQAYLGNVRISSVETLDLRRDIWRAAFPDVVVPAED